MAEETPKKPDVGRHLAMDRTFLADKRTPMAWIRTASCHGPGVRGQHHVNRGAAVGSHRSFRLHFVGDGGMKTEA